MATRTVPEAEHERDGRSMVKDPMVEARAHGIAEPDAAELTYAEPARVGRFGVATVGLIAALIQRGWQPVLALERVPHPLGADPRRRPASFWASMSWVPRASRPCCAAG